jgi:hypothetical protein
VLVDLPCTFFMLNTSTVLDEVAVVARTLVFNPVLVQLARDIRRRMPSSFNGLHMRIETDAGSWITILGGRDQYLSRYKMAMRSGGFDSSTPLYVGTGLLSYASGAREFEQLAADLVSSKLAIAVLQKQMLDQTGVQDLNVEQLALVDLLVLAHSRRFVGIGVSTYSAFLCEIRRMAAASHKTPCGLVEASEIGTDDMFRSAARIGSREL